MKIKTILLTVSAAIAILFVAHNITIIDSDLKFNHVDKASATVSIVRMDERSGGSGTIISSFPNESFVLTNSHVCEVVVNGGFVITDNNSKHTVVAYRQSKLHDLCLVTVNEDLKVNTRIAESAPSLYDEAIISGHPALLPTIITLGHFSQKRSMDVNIGVKACTEEDLAGPSAIYCFLMGGFPIIKTYEVQVVSATIMPGSSGSAVYNHDGAIAGVVFAGQGELGYAMIVPVEYVHKFLDKEVSSLEVKAPIITRTLAAAKNESKDNSCSKIKDETLRAICSIMKSKRAF